MEPLVEIAEAPLDPAASGLGWPVKESFVRYVAALVDGRVRVDGGAALDGAWGFSFPVAAAAFDERTGTGRLGFGGSVRFLGHFGMLALDIASPTLVLRDGIGSLLIGDGPNQTSIAEVAFDFSADDGRARWWVHSVEITAEGAEKFGGVYRAGQPLAPMVVSLSREGGG